MISRISGVVATVEKESKGIQWLKVIIGGESFLGVNYPDIIGPVEKGDEVLLNTLACELGLGTGGFHLVMANLSNPEGKSEKAGHIIKMRYTPYQLRVNAVEEQDSPYHDLIGSFKSLDSLPVMIGSLHSKLAPAAIAYKLKKPTGKLVYIMTDGGSLPIAFSKAVTLLKDLKLIDATITVNHAFGGDYEAVNVYSGLITAKEVLKADAAIICMGPGVVGTGTKWGFSGIEQGEIINAVNILEGKAITIPRITFRDRRDRHKGLSHHTLTILEKVALQPSVVALPTLPEEESELLKSQIREKRLRDQHTFKVIDATDVLKEAERLEIPLSTMGRSIEEEKYYFLTAGAAGILAAE